MGGDLRKNNFWRNIVLLGIALLYVFLGLQIAILFFSNEMLHILGDNDVRDWLYWVGTSGFAVLGLLIGLTYMPAPLSLVNPVYALVPTSAASEHLSAVDSSLSGKSKNY